MTDPTDVEIARAVSQSRALQARFAAIMLRSPRLRWIAGPMRKLFKWAETAAETERRGKRDL